MSQSSQSQRVVILVAVANGNVWTALPGGSTWWPASNSTGKTLITSGVVRSAVNNQKLYFADGSNYLYYDPSTNQLLTWTASAGSLPVDSGGNTPRLIATWRGRTVLSGLLLDGQNWFMSAVSDPTNFNYNPFPYVTTAAVAGNNSTLGLVGDVITSLIPYSDDLLVFGGDHSIWKCVGDPNVGGQIDRVSDAVGIAWGSPWAKDPYQNLYFVSNQTGIYQLQPNDGLVRISQAIEQDLFNIDTGANIIRLIWDDRYQGLHYFVTPAVSAQSTTHFFWEQRTGAWWLDEFANNNHNPLCVCQFDGNTVNDRRALIGSWDGYVRQFSPTQTTDDGSPIASQVVLGPILTADLDDMLLKDVQAVLGATSGSVTYNVYVGPTAEIALSSAPVQTGTWSAGRNPTNFIRRAGHAVFLQLSSTNAWAMESIRARIVGSGKVRQRRYIPGQGSGS